VRLIKESQANKETTKQAREEFKQFADKTKAKVSTLSNNRKQKSRQISRKTTISWKFCKTQGQSTAGEVLALNEKKRPCCSAT
jgi:hypothetical protein